MSWGIGLERQKGTKEQLGNRAQPGISIKTFPEVQPVSIPLSYMSLDASFLCKLA